MNHTSRQGPSLDLSTIKSEAQQCLLRMLNKYDGSKIIIWDEALIGPFESIANTSLLRQYDVTRWFWLKDVRSALNTDCDYVLFLVRNDYQVAKLVSDALQRASRNFLSKTIIVMVPQRCTSFEKTLENNHVELDKLHSIENLPILLFAMDTDLLTMENEFVYRDMHLNEDYSAVHHIVGALTNIQEIYGSIPRVSGQGKAAKLVADSLMKQRRQAPNGISRIHQLIIIDRQIDLYTPLLLQATYEGLIDEIIGIRNCHVTLPQSDKNPDQKRVELRSHDELYSKLRDCDIFAVPDLLKQSAKNLQIEFEDCKRSGKTIHEMGKTVKRLQHHRLAAASQSNHLTIFEMLDEKMIDPEFIYRNRIQTDILDEDRINRVLPDLETLLMRQHNPWNLLRLICLQSIANNGLKSKILEYYKRELIQNYGHDYLLFCMQLERANLLLNRERFYDTGSFTQLKNRFGLDAPLSIAVTKTLMHASQPSQCGNLNILRGPTVVHGEPHIAPPKTSSGEEARVILVFFVGGCTYAEIAALRFMAQQEDCEFLIATTKIINGRTFLEALWPQFS